MDPIDAAVEALKSLKPGERPNISKVAREYGVERSRLSKRYHGVQGSCASKTENMRLLNNTQEKQLLQYIEKLCTRGLPPTREMIRNFAAEIAHQEPGKHWVDRFVERHQIDLISRWTSGIDNKRHKADSAFKYALYFKLLDDKIKQYNIAPSNIYNMDEKGFLIGVVSKMKRVFSRRQYDQGGVKQVLQDGNREWITTIACICADGSSLNPALIYQAASGKIQDGWLQDFNPQEHKAFFASSPTGWTNNELGIAWLKRCFQEETKKKAKRDYRLLILDGHGSHVTMEFIEFCDQNRILLAIYPPHSTHTLQPLDVCLFKPLSAAYTEELSQFMYNSQGLTSITKRDFFRFFYKAYGIAFAKETIINAFRVTGISPLDSNTILKKFKNPEPERPSSSDSTSSVLSASNWRQIERLLRQVVENTSDKRVTQLSHTIHSIAAQKQILQHENNCLRDALVNEKRRRKRGKALLLEPPKDYAGGAVFWSPSKVQAARDRQAQKDAETAEIQRQKDQEKLAKEQKKQERKTILAEKARMRLEAKELKLQEQGQQAMKRQEAQVARAAKKQLKADIQMAKKGKARSLEAPASPPYVIEEPENDVEDLSVSEGVVAASGSSTRTRQIQLPERYRM